MKKSRVPLVMQNELAECGFCCIAMISNYWGHALDLPYLRRRFSSSAQGTSLLEITHCLESLGFRSRALKVPLEEVKYIQCPAILHWNMNHFVVLKQVNKKGVLIHDPALGECHYTLAEFSEAFTGIVLEIEPGGSFHVIRDKSELNLWDLFKTIKGINGFVILLLFLSLLLEILGLSSPLFIQYITDRVIGAGDGTNLSALAAGFSILILLHVLTEYLRGNLVVYLSNHLTVQFAGNIVQHLLKLPLEFFEKRHKGDLQSKFSAIEYIQKRISTDFISTLLDGLLIIIHVSVMFLYSVQLTAIVCCSLCIYLAMRSFSYYGLKKHTERAIIERAQASTLFLETLQGIRSIKAFLKERIRFSAWKNAYVKALNAELNVAQLNVRYSSFNQLLFQSEHLVILCVGASLTMHHQLSLGMLMAVLSYRLSLVNKASNFIQNSFDYKLISIQLNRLSDIVFEEPEALGEGIGKSVKQASLRLEKIGFSYDKKLPPILYDIDLHVCAGEKIAIIGPSGCGKSTLLKVMMGLLKKTQGEIYIDGVSLQEFGLKNYRELTASVLQEDSLLSGSILDNIAFFSEEVDLSAVYESAKLAAIHEDIQRLPMRYETLLGDMGSSLSGGQKQRLLLARALYKKPKFLFLDESTSHLDVANEQQINQALKALDITQIIVAHRQETIQMADRVINLSQAMVTTEL